jgi:hypothetical protein
MHLARRGILHVTCQGRKSNCADDPVQIRREGPRISHDGEMIMRGRVNGAKAAQEVRTQDLEANLRWSRNGNSLRHCFVATATTLKRSQGRGRQEAEVSNEKVSEVQ